MYFYVRKIFTMKAPMSNLVSRILADEKKAKAFSAAVLMASRNGQPVVVSTDGKEHRFVRLNTTPKR